MAKFKDILKSFGQGVGKYMTQEGRDLGQMAKLIVMANRVKRVKPEDFKSLSEYNKALRESSSNYEALLQEQENPTANKILNEILGVTPEEQKRQRASELLTPSTVVKNAALTGSKILPGATSLLGSIGIGAAGGGLAGIGMSQKGKEVESVLMGAGLGAAGGGIGYGVAKGLSSLGKSLAGKVNVKAPKIAGKKATLDWGLGKKDIVDTLGGLDEAQRWATEAYDDAAKLGLPTATRYQRANAISKITETLDNDVNILVNDFDRTGLPAAKANDIIQSLKSNSALSYAKTKDPQTFNWVLQTISDNADDAGNLTMRGLKDTIKNIEGAAGGYKGATGDQVAFAKQIFSSARGTLRDTITNVAPELSNALSKWSKYIKLSPSIIGQTTKQTSIPFVGKMAGTAGTEFSDFLGSLLSGRGKEGAITGPTALQNLLGGISSSTGKAAQFATPLAGAMGGIKGAGAFTEPEAFEQLQELPALGDDDEGLLAIRNSFSKYQQQQGSGNGMGGKEINAVNLMLAQGILNGQISATEANAVLSLLGMEQEDTTSSTSKGTSQGQMDSQNAIDMVGRLSSSLSGRQLTGPIKGLATLSPYATEQKDLQAEIDLARQIVGKFLEGGVLRKEDEEKYKKILPTMYDTQEVAQRKLENLMIELQNRQSQYQQTGYAGYGNSANDTSLYNAGY